MRPILTIWTERHELYPDVPNALELVEGDKKEAVQAIINHAWHASRLLRPARDRSRSGCESCADAIAKASEDPELIKAAEEGNLDLLPSHGDQEQEKITQITAASQGIVPVLKAALESDPVASPEA